MANVLFLICLLLLGGFFEPVQAQAWELGVNPGRTKKADFFDWDYITDVWQKADTWEKFQVERAKYAPEFDPWLIAYKQNRGQAMDDLATLPKKKRQAIERGYDLLLAYEGWQINKYEFWKSGYQKFINASESTRQSWIKYGFGRYKTFDEGLADSRALRRCVDEVVLANPYNECRYFPDWRSPADLEAEAKLVSEFKAVYDPAAAAVKGEK